MLGLCLLLGRAAAPTAAQTGPRCFEETGYCISGPIRASWEQNGGLSVFGFPITPQRIETVEGRTLEVQWFELDRLEIQVDGIVTAGRLGHGSGTNCAAGKPCPQVSAWSRAGSS
jgi:hypothetical protein